MDSIFMHREGLLEAKKYFGTFKRLAKLLGVKPQTISDWASFRHQMPVRYAFKLIQLTQGKIPFSALTVYLHPDDRDLGALMGEHALKKEIRHGAARMVK